MTVKEFRSLVESRIIFLDGATGSNLQSRGMPTGVCPEQWIIENKEVLAQLQKEFLDAGTDILLAPTFTANRIKLEEYGLESRIREMNHQLVKVSKSAVKAYRESTGNDRRIFIAADLSMTGRQVYPVGDLQFEELVEIYKEQIRYILEEGVDLFFLETMMSLQECRAALLAIKETCDLPVMISLTFNENGRTFYGTDGLTAVTVLQAMGVDAVGLNCSMGPDKMQGLVREMKAHAHVPIIVKPNAGIPKLVDGETVFPMNPEEFAVEMKHMVELGANIIGGCCGTTPSHIEAMVNGVKGFTPEAISSIHHRALTTERTTLEIPLEGSFLVVGERINPTGKKQLQEQLRSGDMTLVEQMATEQVAQGARILDINVGMNGIDELDVMVSVMEEALRATSVPLCIDTSKIEVMETVLRLYPGRALMNSISLEKEKFEKLLPLAKKYGAMFILLPLSDRGMPKDLDEKKEIIHIILERALELGLTKEDIIVDGLVNTVGANEAAAKEAIETIRYCKELGLGTIAGLSNISFGLPERQFVNSTFLAFAIQAGLTMAIANPSQDLLMNTALAADLLLGKEDSATKYIEGVRKVEVQSKMMSQSASGSVKESGGTEGQMKFSQPLGKKLTGTPSNTSSSQARFEEEEKEAIYQAVIKGNKGQILTLVEAYYHKGNAAETIIEEILIPAINQVGDLFDRQIYFLPQLIAGAETMKKAIEYLEPKIVRKADDKPQGTIVIGTVAGDIHDIGKNLVVLMLKNYGYRVIDLGKDVPTKRIIEVAKEEKADIIGLSALMTTTMVEMKKVVDLAREEGVTARIIIGGAVITDSYCEEIGADGYSPDAQSAVGLVKRLLQPKS